MRLTRTLKFAVMTAAVTGASIRLHADPAAVRFTVDGAEAHDTVTNLTWQRCSVGQHWTRTGCVGVVRQMSWTEAMHQGRNGWRLPTKDELLTLVAPAARDPAIDEQVFPDMEINKLWYWSGTEYGSSAWYVAFGSGSAHTAILIDTYAVRLVKK
jgi:Protein of unknown function (DUF1566)